MNQTPLKTAALLICLALSSMLTGQANVIKWNPFNLIVGQTTVSYERVINEQFSANVAANFISWDNTRAIDISSLDFGINEINVNADLSGIGFTPEVRYYPIASQTAPEGFYIAPYLNLTFADFTLDGIEGNLTANGKIDINLIAAGGIVGYQFISSKGITLDLFAGIGATFFDIENVGITVTDTDSNETRDIESPIDLNFIAPVIPRFGVSIGYAF